MSLVEFALALGLAGVMVTVAVVERVRGHI